jgi:hypothetical protein
LRDREDTEEKHCVHRRRFNDSGVRMNTAPTTARNHPPPDFSRISAGARIDPALAALDDCTHNRLVPFVLHESFIDCDDLSDAQVRELRIKQAALRLAAGLESRTIRALASEIGCAPNALHKSLLRLCERIGLRPFIRSDETRRALSEAQRRRVERERHARA